MFMMLRAGVAASCLAAVLALGAPPVAIGFGPISSFGSFGEGPGQMREARGMAIASSGLIYVADYRNHRIDVFAPDGSFLRAFGKEVAPAGGDVCALATGCKPGSPTGMAGGLDKPADVAVNVTGEVFVADERNNRIDVFTAEGQFLRAFGKDVHSSGDICTPETGCQSGDEDDSGGALSGPQGVDIDSAGQVYVANVDSNRIEVFTAEGTFLRAFGQDVGPSGADVCTAATAAECMKGESEGAAGSIDEPLDVAVDAGGQVAVADSGSRRIDVFTTEGAFLRAFGKNVSGDLLCLITSKCGVCTAANGCKKGTESDAAGGLNTPSALVVSDAGSLYVADSENHRINEFTFAGAFLRAFGEGVVNSAPAFQVCTAESTCKSGLSSSTLGSVSAPSGTAVDCRGAVYAVEGSAAVDFARIERFTEPGTPPCAQGGPLPEPPTPPSPPTQPPAGGPPGTSILQAVPAATPPRGPLKPSFKIELNKWDGTATLAVAISDAGALLLRGKGIRKVKRNAKRVGLIELLIEATGKAERKLRKTGKAKVKLSLTFTPDGGAPSTQAASVTLKRGPRL